MSPSDRLVGAARLAQKHGIEALGLAWGIAGALAYDNAEDDHAVALQKRVEAEGLEGAMERLCGIAEDEPLAKLVRERYDTLMRSTGLGRRNGLRAVSD